MENLKLNTIEEAIEDFKQGKFVIVVDDEDRENEGDLIIAAEKITADDVNFMLKHARGVLCAPITISRCDELDLPHQVSENTSMLGTPFTVTVDKLEGCSTCQSFIRSRQWCLAAVWPYLSCNRSLPHGRTLSSRRSYGDNERRWHHGAPAAVAGFCQAIRSEGYLYQGYDSLEIAQGESDRDGARG